MRQKTTTHRPAIIHPIRLRCPTLSEKSEKSDPVPPDAKAKNREPANNLRLTAYVSTIYL
jgi:hypothetical protein